MLDKKFFARDFQGNVKTKQPCPNGDHPNYHVCLVGKEDTFPELVKKRNYYGGGRPRGFTMREEHKEAISEALKDRFEARRAVHAERDKKIVEEHRQGATMNGLGRKYGISTGTVKGVLKRARAKQVA